MVRFASHTRLPSELLDEQARIEAYARDFGLDFFPLFFEVLSFDQMNEVASYGGFPSRYPHWRFGMEYERLAKSHEYGLSKIYEMVINNNPSVAYLLEGNSLIEQKLVMAHVYAHVDFFKNNYVFNSTNQGVDPRTGGPIRKWIDTFANHGAIIRRWVDRVGVEEVERFIDVCLGLDNLIDPTRQENASTNKSAGWSDTDELAPEVPLLRVDREYMTDYINPREFVDSQRERLEIEQTKDKVFPSEPAHDVLAFLVEHAPLERWERDVLQIVRREACYFAPQGQTKIMNEGWATYWHSKIITEKAAHAGEIIDYADRCASVLAVQPGQLNPYKLGVELFRHIEDRWNKGRFGTEWDNCDDMETRRAFDRRVNLGREKLFEVRAFYNDVTFIDEFLTPDFVAHNKMYAFGYSARNSRWEIESRVFDEVKEKLLLALTNGGHPRIYIADANGSNRGELVLSHVYSGIDLRIDYAESVLAGLASIWKRPVELHTIIEGKESALRYDGAEHSQRSL
ncbi:MAG: SpoVR family protein [Myxococcales bacterium]|nr:SpoVR family protein [Myxococcales bacterium]